MGDKLDEEFLKFQAELFEAEMEAAKEKPPEEQQNGALPPPQLPPPALNLPPPPQQQQQNAQVPALAPPPLAPPPRPPAASGPALQQPPAAQLPPPLAPPPLAPPPGSQMRPPALAPPPMVRAAPKGSLPQHGHLPPPPVPPPQAPRGGAVVAAAPVIAAPPQPNPVDLDSPAGPSAVPPPAVPPHMGAYGAPGMPHMGMQPAGGFYGGVPTTAPQVASSVGGKKVGIVRQAAGKRWVDTTLTEWPENDFRVFVGNLGNEVSDAVLTAAFQKFPTFQKAKVVRYSHNGKSKGYGFVSFGDQIEGAKVIKEMQGKYVGNRPVQLKKSATEERTVTDRKGNVRTREVEVRAPRPKKPRTGGPPAFGGGPRW